MELKVKEIITNVVLISLLVGWGIIQTGLKSMPQIVLILVGLITFGLTYLNNKVIFKIPYYMILGTIIFTSMFGLITKIVDVFLPNRGMVEIDGQLYGTNGDPYIFQEGIFALILTIGLLIFDFLKWKTDIKLQKYFILTFTVLSSVIWMIYEM